LHESASIGISQLNLSNEFARIILIIGPEGGISDAEISQLEAAGAVTARMGELVLRSAHAGFAALSAVQSSIGRW
jgi:16S rRNA (uracil1498-N3)-methyltransferase